jgi:hypothetical protein
VCKVEGCDKEIASVGVCWTHYQYAYRLRKLRKLPDSLDPAILEVINKPNKPKPQCSICGLEVHAKGLCKTHYNRGLRRAPEYNDSELMNQLKIYSLSLRAEGKEEAYKAIRQFIARITNA